MYAESVQCQYVVLVTFKEQIDSVCTSESFVECMSVSETGYPTHSSSGLRPFIVTDGRWERIDQ